MPPEDFKIGDEEIKCRKDFRNLNVFTIDDASTRDIDDALSFEKIDYDVASIGVHIADVTHFVKKNSALDSEA